MVFLFYLNPHCRSRVVVEPLIQIFIPHKSPRVGITHPHHVAAAGFFVNGIAGGVTRRDAESPEYERGGGGEVFAMPAACFEQESAEWCLICFGGARC